MDLSKEEMDNALVRLEEKLLQICKNDGIKYDSNKFYEVQAALIAGFIAAVDVVPPGLGIAIMARRPIVNEF